MALSDIGSDIYPATFDEEYNHAVGFMITEDAALSIETSQKKKRNYAAGTFNIKTIYPSEVIKVYSDGTDVTAGKVFFVRGQ